MKIFQLPIRRIDVVTLTTLMIAVSIVRVHCNGAAISAIAARSQTVHAARIITISLTTRHSSRSRMGFFVGGAEACGAYVRVDLCRD